MGDTYGMLRPRILGTAVCAAAAAATFALTVPTDVQMPGTQPNEVVGIQYSGICGSCHGFYQPDVEPFLTWRGSMMAHASRDPLFWAAMAVAEQDFAGAGDLCLRCHTPTGWIAGHSTPTDGSGLTYADGEGVECMVCHRLVDPDESQWDGVQNPPFIANSGGGNPEGWHGSGMMVLADGEDRYGPYANVYAPHGTRQSNFHRESALCGTCHDVSNPLTGDLAPGNGAQIPLPPGSYSGVPGDPVTSKAAFLNPPHAYGVVERTYSEHVASSFETTPVAAYAALPAELQGGIVERAWSAALAAGRGGDYEDGTPRSFTCQTCHMIPAVAAGCSLPGSPVRRDLPVHDLTGGNTWAPRAIRWLDQRGLLQIGGGLNSNDYRALEQGVGRARQMLRDAALLEYDTPTATLKVINRTGHKLITGYPEGRRMWLNARWYDAQGALLREDGAYGEIIAHVAGRAWNPRTILDLENPQLLIWQAVTGISQEWAAKLLAMGTDPATPLEFERLTGAPVATLGQLAAQPPGTRHASFHFALNDVILADNRIPPWGLRYDDALVRNCLPVPQDQFGDPGPGGSYRHWDEVALTPPPGAKRAEFRLLYQSTSWEYVMSLVLGNDGSVPHLADVGLNLARAWHATGMAEPELMAQLDVVLP
jgi:hypothetical protein